MKKLSTFLAAAALLSVAGVSGASAGLINTRDDPKKPAVFQANGLSFSINVADITANDKINKRGIKKGLTTIQFLGFTSSNPKLVSSYSIDPNTGDIVINFKPGFTGTVNIRYAAQGKKGNQFLGETSRSKLKVNVISP